MQVSEAMTANPVCCDKETTIAEAALLMLRHDIGCIPVIDGIPGRVVGVVTDRDIAIRAVAARRNPEETKVGEVMSHPVATIPCHATLEECLQMMETNRVRRTAVVDHHNCVVGIVSQADVARKATEHQVAEFIQQISRSIDLGHR